MKKNFTILLTEDNDEQAFLTEEAFQKAGWKGMLHRVRDGHEAINYLEGQGEFGDRAKFPYPGLVLLDLWMPGMNGFELLQWIREQPAHTTLLVFIFTHEEDEPMIRRAYDLAANCLIPKPKDFNEIVRMAERLKNYLELIQVPPREM